MSTIITTHRQPNGTEWIHGVAGNDAESQRYQWVCINPDGSNDRYLCSQHGWIESCVTPKHPARYIVNTTHGSRYSALWGYGQWALDHDDLAKGWMPMPEAMA